MGCNDPLAAWKAKDKTNLGKRPLVFNIHDACIDLPVNIRCGKCLGCRTDRAREWAIRCTHKASMHDENSFVTLTYNDEHVPRKNGHQTLYPRDFTLFLKRLRKARNHTVRFLQCGEYGNETQRPHHHALLFNCAFHDRTLWRKNGDYALYRSEELEKLWPWGHSEIGEVNQATAGYVAGYTTKIKETKSKNKVPEYLTMSRRPGIGRLWLEKYITDVYPSDEIITKKGTRLKPPRYYDTQLEKLNPQLHEKLKGARYAKLTEEMKSGLRLTAREKILRAKTNERKRGL